LFGGRQNVLISLFKMNESLTDVATESAVVLAAGVAALQLGPGSDGTWQEIRYRHLRNQASDRLDERTFDDTSHRGHGLTIDTMIELALVAVDEAWPQLVA
jgi:hypothetical protein